MEHAVVKKDDGTDCYWRQKSEENRQLGTKEEYSSLGVVCIKLTVTIYMH